MKLTLRLALSCSLLTLASNALAVSPVRADNLKSINHNQQINSYEDFQLHCSREAYYYNLQSSECNKYYPAGATSVMGEEKIGMDRQFKQFYLQQLENLNSNLKKAEDAQNLEQLHRAQKALSKTIEELEKIPVDAAIHSSVWQTISESRSHLNDVNVWVAREYRARYEVLRARVLSYEAEKLTKNAITVSDYQVAQAKWNGVQQLLSSVPLGVFVVEDVKSLQTFASVQENNVVAQIGVLLAKEMRGKGQLVSR